MLVVTGTALVLLTWTACAGLLVSVGLVPALLVASRSAGRAAIIRRAVWWGLLIVTVLAYVVNLAWPLGSGQAALTVLLVGLALGIPGWALLARRARGVSSAARAWTWSDRLLVSALIAAVVYLAVAALGPVTNYDSGLYLLGAIRYAADFPTIPGLANLYYALAYGNAEFPLAALLGNGPWGGNGFRLLNGLLVALAAAELVLRWRSRRTVGAFVLLAGMVSLLVPLVALSDYWVTSPTQDSAVLVLTVIATALIADAVWGSRDTLADGTLAIVLGIELVLLRPTMLAFAAATVGVMLVIGWRRRTSLSARGFVRAAALVLGLGAVAGVAATARDYLLSGWLQFPLSVHAFDVPWRAADPTMDRLATLGFHRNAADLWASTEGWTWVVPWLRERVHQWETYELGALLLCAVVLLVLAARRGIRPRALALTMAPSVVADLVWFLATPPSYRFAWGPLLTLGTIPIGWSLWVLARGQAASGWRALAAVGVVVPVLAVVAFSGIARLDLGAMTGQGTWRLGVAIPYAVAPVAEPPTRAVATVTGLTLLQPTESDQCWWRYPMCTPRPDAGLALRGDGIASGFVLAPAK